MYGLFYAREHVLQQHRLLLHGAFDKKARSYMGGVVMGTDGVMTSWRIKHGMALVATKMCYGTLFAGCWLSYFPGVGLFSECRTCRVCRDMRCFA